MKFALQAVAPQGPVAEILIKRGKITSTIIILELICRIRFTCFVVDVLKRPSQTARTAHLKFDRQAPVVLYCARVNKIIQEDEIGFEFARAGVGWRGVRWIIGNNVQEGNLALRRGNLLAHRCSIVLSIRHINFIFVFLVFSFQQKLSA